VEEKMYVCPSCGYEFEEAGECPFCFEMLMLKEEFQHA